MHYFQQILKDLNVKSTVSFAKNLFDNTKNASSYYGIKKMLEIYGLKINAVQVEKDEIDNLEYPIICLDGGYFRVFKKKPSAKFIEEWNGVALQVSGKGREPNYLGNQISLWLQYALPYIYTVAFLFVMVFSFLNEFSHTKLILTALNGIGLYFSYRTVAEECSGSCKEVLNSSASKVLGVFSLGMIGLSYFLASMLVILFIPLLKPSMILISCIAVLMPAWSLTYQAFVLRKWCYNCILVQVAVILIFCTLLVFNMIDFTGLTWFNFVTTISLFILVFSVGNKIYNQKQKLNKYPTSLINSYYELLDDPKIKVHIINSGEIHNIANANSLVLRKPKTKELTEIHEITVVLSPYCIYCKDLFNKIHLKAINGLLNDYYIKVVFAPNKTDKNIYSCFIAEFLSSGNMAAIRLMAEWYSRNQIRRFDKMYNNMLKDKDLTDKVFAIMDSQEEWFRKNKFTGTPVVLIDGHIVNHLLIDGIV